MEREKLQELIKQMTLEEKASLCSGADFWHTESVDRLGIPAMMVSDGPHGLRKQDQEADHLGMNDSIKAVCFPAGCGQLQQRADYQNGRDTGRRMPGGGRRRYSRAGGEYQAFSSLRT